ncbi:MAG: bifunctional metallophosphatase/5'-nucleotidase [Spirochaetes bacterium]|nr:MAG: bifunctional metallophosphatase/5'-nucleotidase [Spirochaetota bacterium]
MKRLLAMAAALLFACAIPLIAADKTITILHTNDLHSHLMGFSPELDYTPAKAGDDATIGGYARLATAIKTERKARTNPVLLLDAGDFTMGSLFHMAAREEAFELRIMKAMGYDMVTLGNHEFDLMPKGLAGILTAGAAKGMPEIVFSSAIFSAESDKDDSLEAVFKKGVVKSYTVKIIDGIKVGFFGVIGDIAIGDSPFASPVKFKNKIEASREMVKLLREQEKAEMVICISHSGLYLGSESEDEALAKQVPGIDVIVSGHTHTMQDKPLLVNGVIIVQAYEYGKFLGVLDVAWANGKASVEKYKLVEINDSIPADMTIQGQIDGFIAYIDQAVLREHNLSYWKVIAETGFDLKTIEDESPIGNLITDSIRWYVNKYDSDPADPVTKVALGVESNGVIRDHLLKGKTGKVCVADVFRTIPLGVGMDDTMAYPLVTIYVYASEIKKALEVLTSIYPMKGNDYFLQLSGVKFTYNPHRVIFDRVTEIWLGSEEEGFKELDYSSGNTQLYRIAANIYDTTFLKVVGDYTFHFLDIVPKDRKGQTVTSLVDQRVDADKNKPGIQELKEWVGVMDFIRSFKDTDNDGTPDIPAKYAKSQGRIVKQPSWNPVSLLSRGTKLTWIAFAAFIVFIALIALVVRIVRKKFMVKEMS